MKFIIITLAICLAITLVSSAPTEDLTPATPTENASADATNTDTSSAKPSEDASSTGRATAPGQNMIEGHSHLVNSTFTCVNREPGYYADIDTECKVYHFCALGDYNGQEMYQRVSYLCTADNVFDQQILDCVESSKMKAPCNESNKYYEESNVEVRKEVLKRAKEAQEKSAEKKHDEETKHDEEKKHDDEKKHDEEKKHEDEKEHDKKHDEEDEKSKKNEV